MTRYVRWFTSRHVRHAVDVCRHVRKLARAQRDLVLPADLAKVQESIGALRESAAKGSRDDIQQAMNDIEKVVGRHLKPYPYARWRENVEVFLVTGAIVLALRTFFFQPMAIPSGSAQPTLWGIQKENLKNQPDVTIPGVLRRVFESCWSGVGYYHKVAEQGGELTYISQPRWQAPFLRKQTLRVGGVDYTLRYASSLENLAQMAGLYVGQQFQKGEDLIRFKATSGDHLFVNRMVYNFKRPRRGDIIVFSSHGIPRLIKDTHYIKRLVALGGDRVRIGNDRHLVINGERLDASTPGFENVYGFDPRDPPRDSHYSGHANQQIASRYKPSPPMALLFPNEQTERTVRQDHYLAMGDNTMNSFDGRDWGDFPREKVVGRSSFVFWPISRRFGWGYR